MSTHHHAMYGMQGRRSPGQSFWQSGEEDGKGGSQGDTCKPRREGWKADTDRQHRHLRHVSVPAQLYDREQRGGSGTTDGEGNGSRISNHAGTKEDRHKGQHNVSPILHLLKRGGGIEGVYSPSKVEQERVVSRTDLAGRVEDYVQVLDITDEDLPGGHIRVVNVYDRNPQAAGNQ